VNGTEQILKNWLNTANKQEKNHATCKYSPAKLMRRMAFTYNGARFVRTFHPSRFRQFWVLVNSRGHPWRTASGSGANRAFWADVPSATVRASNECGP
jgi:hypothetical protein